MTARRTTLAPMPPLAAAIGLTLATAAGAAEPPLEIIVHGQAQDVSSPKLTAPLLNTPQVISVIPQNVFNQQGAQSLTDVLRNTPGITFNAGENGFTSGLSNFSMRGFDSSGNIFVDGVRDSGSYVRDVFNTEQVEVVKGPSGDNGRGSAGGFVNIVTKMPNETASAKASVSYGLDSTDAKDRVRVSADVNQPLSNNAAARMNVMWQDGGVAGREVAKKKGWGVAPSFSFGLQSATRFDVSFLHTESDDRPDWGVPAVIIDGMLRYDATVDKDEIRDNFYGLTSDFDDTTSDALLARVTHSFSSGLIISNQTRWVETSRASHYTLPTGYTAASQTVTTQRQAFARDNQSWSNQTNLRGETNTGGIDHTFAIGFEYAYDKANADRFPAQTNPGTGAVISINTPNPDRAAAWAQQPTQHNSVRVETLAGYAYDTMELTPQWQLNGGLRVENYKVTLDSSTAAGAPLGGDAYAEKRTTLSGKFGAVYKPVEDGSVYAAVGLAAQPPASYLSTPDISREGDNAFPGFSVGLNSANAKTQKSLNYEAGVKWNFFNDTLNATAAVFRTERRNVAISGIEPGVAPPPPVALLGYGKQIVEGVEFSATGQITESWTILGGVLVQDSKRKHSARLDEGRRLANPGDYGTVLTTNGDELAFTANFSANLWTTYTLPIGLTLGGGVQHTGSSWVGRPDDAERIISNGNVGELPGYTVANVMAEYPVTANVLVRLNIDNVTNELYAASTNWPVQRVLLGPPRSFLLSTHLSF